MPTFTINRILPVVEMLNFYATANNPRWQAIGVEGSDSDVAAVFSDIADYIWGHSDGDTLYSNAINDSITKSIGYLMVEIDKDADNGMGEVKISQPEPFDIFVDQKSRDIMFRDASYIMIRKVLPKSHLIATRIQTFLIQEGHLVQETKELFFMMMIQWTTLALLLKVNKNH